MNRRVSCPKCGHISKAPLFAIETTCPSCAYTPPTWPQILCLVVVSIWLILFGCCLITIIGFATWSER